MLRAIIGLLLLPHLLFAAKLNDTISSLIDDCDPDLNVSVYAKNISTKQVLIDYASNRFMIPASVNKVFAAASAEKLLGPDYRYRTIIAANGDSKQIKQLIIKFDGDPSLHFSHLDDMVSQTANQINHVSGDVVIDLGLMRVPSYAPGWMIEDTYFCYGAPLSSAIIDRNCLGFEIKDQGSGKLQMRAHNPSVSITNQASLGNCSEPMQIDEHASEEGINLIISGCLSKKQLGWHAIPVKNLDVYLTSMIRFLLKKHNISYSGNVRIVRDSSGMEIASHESEPLTKIIRKAMKESDNLYTDQLFLTVASKYHPGVSEWEEAGRLVHKSLVKNFKTDLSRTIIYDGSGLSPYNTVTARQLTNLLAAVHKDKKVYAQFHGYFPKWGHDGTLKSRPLFKDIRSKYEIYAKTGTTSRTRNLTGYIVFEDGNTIAFAILIQGIPGEKVKYSRLQNEIVRAMLSTH